MLDSGENCCRRTCAFIPCTDVASGILFLKIYSCCWTWNTSSITVSVRHRVSSWNQWPKWLKMKIFYQHCFNIYRHPPRGRELCCKPHGFKSKSQQCIDQVLQVSSVWKGSDYPTPFRTHSDFDWLVIHADFRFTWLWIYVYVRVYYIHFLVNSMK